MTREFNFWPMWAIIQPVVAFLQDYEVLDVMLLVGGHGRPRKKFRVVHPWGATGPYRYGAAGRDVIDDLLAAKVDPGYLDYLKERADEFPPEAREIYEEYLGQLEKARRIRSYAPDKLEKALQVAKLTLDELREEERDPRGSLQNAYVLLNRWGLPDRLRLCHY